MFFINYNIYLDTAQLIVTNNLNKVFIQLFTLFYPIIGSVLSVRFLCIVDSILLFV